MRGAAFLVLTAILIAGSMDWPLSCSREQVQPNCCRGGVCMMKMHQDVDGACLCSADSPSQRLIVAVRGVLAVPSVVRVPELSSRTSAVAATASPLLFARSIDQPPKAC